ncbi:hypothetical protein [Methanoregula sp.]|uniref:hypothetical protein n=1 Tax=Methanoregula sp. TaxID=2052170 RepID=UPI000CC1B186|nr:hypothetical protein [Methanoregula sp.]PKG31260.1 MAG: hypothetical protein CW742_14350 [Methanoregula sp.]
MDRQPLIVVGGAVVVLIVIVAVLATGRAVLCSLPEPAMLTDSGRGRDRVPAQVDPELAPERVPAREQAGITRCSCP